MEPAPVETPIGDFAPCSRCGRTMPRTTDDSFCHTCFAQLLNQVGTPVDQPAKPPRLTFHQVGDAEQVGDAIDRGVLPEAIHETIADLADGIRDQLIAAVGNLDPEVFRLYAHARRHGLLVMVVVQPAKVGA